MRVQLRRAVPVTTALLAASIVTGGAPAASQDSWAPAGEATVHPGVQMITEGAQCTANFIFTDASDVYIGYAAHCAGTGAATDTNGCDAGVRPIGTPVEIAGATQPGELAYSSWVEMQHQGETDPDACDFNDFALVRIHPDDHGRVNPSIPHWGGPTGLNTEGTSLGSTVYSFGNSSLRGGLTVLSPKTGVSLGTSGGGWAHATYTLTPGIPGDSGSAMLDSQGRGAGVLSTLVILPAPASNNYIDLAHALDYMRAQDSSFAGVELVNGTEAFNPNQLPIGIGL